MRSKNIRLFESDFLEALTHVHPLVPLMMWTPVITYLLWRSIVVFNHSQATLCIIAISAIIFWSLFEYVLHRFIFHLNPRSKLGRRLVYLVHGIHHDDPHDATRLMMPPIPGAILATFFYVIFWTLMGESLAVPFFGFFLIGYLIYDYTHYAIHHFRPQTPIGKFLRRYHHTHHFAHHNTKWGVSSPLWDFLLGTMESPETSREDH